MKRTVAAVVALALLSVANLPTHAAEIVRQPLGGGNTLSIARAVSVPAGFELIFHSGFTPQPANPIAKEGTPEYCGETKTQSLAVFAHLQDSLKLMGLGFVDVVKLNVFLVGEPASGRMDFKGFMEAYTQYFGTKDQPNLPARSAMQVAAINQPGMLVGIEVVLARRTQ